MNISMGIGMILGVLIGLILLSILTLVFRWLWNTTVPDVFGVNSVTFWQAFKILLISAILFGGSTTVMEHSNTAVPDTLTSEISS